MSKLSTATVFFLGALLLASSVEAQTSSGGWFVDTNVVSVQSNQHAQVYATSAPSADGGIPKAIRQGFPTMGGNGFDVGGGYTFSTGVGAGARWTRVYYHYLIDTSIEVPIPFLPSYTASGSGQQESRRFESALDLMATYTLPIPKSVVQVRLFGGPTLFNVRQAMVVNVTNQFVAEGTWSNGNMPDGITEDLTHVVVGNTINGGTIRADIRDVETKDVDGTGWGYNVGADAVYFFSRHVGAAGGLRYNHGTVQGVPIPINNPVAGDANAEFDTGHVTIAAGLRLRF